VLEKGHRSHQSRIGEPRIVLRALRQQDQKHSGALRMADVVHLPAVRPRQHVIHDGGQVVDANLVPAELPEAGVARGQSAVAAGVGCAPGISQPDIKTAGMQLQSQGSSPAARHKIAGGAKEAVHQDKGAQMLGTPGIPGGGNSVHTQQISIGGLHAMHLTFELLPLYRLANRVYKRRTLTSDQDSGTNH